MNTKQNWSWAFEQLKAGEKVKGARWDKGFHLFMQDGDIRICSDTGDTWSWNAVDSALATLVSWELHKAPSKQDKQSTPNDRPITDSDRIDWLSDPENRIGNVQLPRRCVEEHLGSLRDAIDAAMAMSEEEERHA